MSSQYDERWPTNDSDRSTSLGHPSTFQRVSRLAFVTAATSVTGGQPNFARCLAVSWAGTLYIHFRGSCALTEFCQVQNPLYDQVLRSPILAALLHCTLAAAVSQTLWRGTGNGITELSQRAPPVFGWAAIALGIGHILVDSVIGVFLENSENDSKLKDWINFGIYWKNLLSHSRPWPWPRLSGLGLGLDTSGLVNITE